MKLPLKILCLVLFFIKINVGNGQILDSSGIYSLKFSAGIGTNFYFFPNDSNMPSYIDATGFLGSIGVQQHLFNDKLRLNANFTGGHFSNQTFFGPHSNYFLTAMDLKGDINIFHIGQFSFVGGLGAFACYTEGRTRASYPDFGSVIRGGPFYHVDMGAEFCLGFRVKSKSDQYAIEFIPLNSYIGAGSGSFSLRQVKVGLDWRLKNR